MHHPLDKITRITPTRRGLLKRLADGRPRAECPVLADIGGKATDWLGAEQPSRVDRVDRQTL